MIASLRTIAVSWALWACVGTANIVVPEAEPLPPPVAVQVQRPAPEADALPDAGGTSVAAPAQPIELPEPPWQHTAALPDALPARAPAIVQRSRKRNGITDEERWFADLGIARPVMSGRIRIDGALLTLMPEDDAGVERVFDFARYLYAPGSDPDGGLLAQEITWAVMEDGVLYVSHGHRTYAESSGGLNAYITAVDAETGELRWRSAPLVANSRNFLVRGPHILTGYGFTAEPDYLYVLDRATGAVLLRKKLASGPDYLVEQDRRLHVRCYDTDYLFELR